MAYPPKGKSPQPEPTPAEPKYPPRKAPEKSAEPKYPPRKAPDPAPSAPRYAAAAAPAPTYAPPKPAEPHYAEPATSAPTYASPEPAEPRYGGRAGSVGAGAPPRGATGSSGPANPRQRRLAANAGNGHGSNGVPPGLPKWAPGPPNAKGFAPAFPILTEEVGFAPSPLASLGTSSQTSGMGGSRGGSLGPVVSQALQRVLGWKVRYDDPKGFVGALNQSFDLTMFEGHVVTKWKPRSHAVATDLSGGIAGAQSSLYAMAQTMLGQMLPLIEGLRPLDPASDDEYVTVLREMATSQFSELVGELRLVGGPRVARVNQYFQMLLGIELSVDTATGVLTITAGTAQQGQPVPPAGITAPWTQPDYALGVLGNIRDAYGLSAVPGGAQSYVNSVDDEQAVTQFRILVDYTNALLNSWQNNIAFFMTANTPFLGTQLVSISRQLGLVNELVDEVRFVLDSVFIGPAERVALTLSPLVDPETGADLPPIGLEALLSWVQAFVTEEGPAIIRTGGRLGIGDDFSSTAEQLTAYAFAAYSFAQDQAGSALSTDRVQFALYKLASHLHELHAAASAVGVTYLAPRP